MFLSLSREPPPPPDPLLLRDSSELSALPRHVGGIAYDENHMLDQIMWMMGDRRPLRTTGFLTNVRPETPTCAPSLS